MIELGEDLSHVCDYTSNKISWCIERQIRNNHTKLVIPPRATVVQLYGAGAIASDGALQETLRFRNQAIKVFDVLGQIPQSIKESDPVSAATLL